MKKSYIGSSKLHYNYKMFRIRYQNANQCERIKQEVMNIMHKYLQNNDGKLINIKQLKKCQELIVYFVTGEDQQNQGWENYFKNNLLKNYYVMPNVIEIGPAGSGNGKNNG